VEDDPERRSLPAEHRCDAVAHGRPVEAARTPDGTVAGGEDEERARVEVDHVSTRLLPRPALDEHELAAGEVADGAQERDSLQGEGDVAVDILVEGVVAALAVAQDERRRPLLAGFVAAVQERVQPGGQVGRLAQLLRPAVGRLGQRRVERAAGRGDRLRQRMVEIAIRALAEAVRRISMVERKLPSSKLPASSARSGAVRMGGVWTKPSTSSRA
jgi:hypothetical protein